jgi:hypothetical protein
VTTDYMGITITFKCKDGHPNEWKTSVLPRRGSSPMWHLAIEQAAFKQAFALRHPCPCGAFIDGDPKVNYREFPDLRSPHGILRKMLSSVFNRLRSGLIRRGERLCHHDPKVDGSDAPSQRWRLSGSLRTSARFSRERN